MNRKIKNGFSIVFVLIIFLGIFVGCKKEIYSSISCDRVKGTSEVIGNDRNENAYEGMHLYTGDNVNVKDRSNLILELDMEQHLFADERTVFKVNKSSDKKGTDTKIIQTIGGTLNRIDKPLANGDSYEVETPNSTLSVRGTDFNVVVEKDKNGFVWTRLDVYSGEVFVTLNTTKYKKNGVSHYFKAGEAGLIRADEDFSEFVIDKETDNIERKASFNHLSEAGLKSLLETAKEKGSILSVHEKEIKQKIIEKATEMGEEIPDLDSYYAKDSQGKDMRNEKLTSIKKPEDKLENTELAKGNMEEGFERESIIPDTKVKKIAKEVDGEEQIVAVLVYEDEEEAPQKDEEEKKIVPQFEPKKEKSTFSEKKTSPTNEPKLPEKTKEPKTIETSKSTPTPTKPKETMPSGGGGGDRETSSDKQPSPPPKEAPISPPPQKVLLNNISVDTKNAKTNYTEGELFSSKGIVVMAAYSDGTTKDVTNQAEFDKEGKALSLSDKSVTVSYQENGVTKLATVDVKVSPATLISIEITTPPTKTTYTINDKFDGTGMVVTANYNNNTSKEVNTYTVSPETLTTAGNTSVTVSYTDGDITKEVNLPITVYPYDPKDIFAYTQTASDIAITGLTEKGKTLADIFIPKAIDNLPITSIGDSAFYIKNSNKIKTISFEQGSKLDTIGNYAFANGNFTSVEIPNNVTSIGEGAFYLCSNLSSINIPESVTSIGENAFDGCTNITSINIPASITRIEASTFKDCKNLSNIIIPPKVTFIGTQAFLSCEALTEITIPASVEKLDGVATFAYCNSLSKVTFEPGSKITSINDSTFRGCAITEITIPPSVTTINIYAFRGSNKLEKIYLQGDTSLSGAPWGANNAKVFDKDNTQIYPIP